MQTLSFKGAKRGFQVEGLNKDTCLSRNSVPRHGDGQKLAGAIATF